MTTEFAAPSMEPRSMARIITDFGSDDAPETGGQVAEEITSEVDDEEVSGDTDSPPTETDDLDAVLDAAEATQAPTEEAQAWTPPDFNAPEMADLKAAFEEKMGISLEDAYAKYTEAVELTSRTEEQQTVDTVRQIQAAWGVNDAEFNRRAVAVTEYVSKLSPEDQKKLDSVAGVQKVWARIEKQSKVGGKSRASGGVSPRTQEAKPTFKKSELMEMQIKDPKKYTSLQSKISQAYREGRVTND